MNNFGTTDEHVDKPLVVPEPSTGLSAQKKLSDTSWMSQTGDELQKVLAGSHRRAQDRGPWLGVGRGEGAKPCEPLVRAAAATLPTSLAAGGGASWPQSP